MPGFIAKKLCPELVFVRPNFERCASQLRGTQGQDVRP